MSESDAIGGYFSLEIAPSKGGFHHGAHAFQSARAAFLALLLKGLPERVWMPWFICDSMIKTHLKRILGAIQQADITND